MNPEDLADELVARAGWVCPSCVVRSIAVRVDGAGIAVQVVHAPRCPDAAAWVLQTAPPLISPDSTGGTAVSSTNTSKRTEPDVAAVASTVLAAGHAYGQAVDDLASRTFRLGQLDLTGLLATLSAAWEPLGVSMEPVVDASAAYVHAWDEWCRRSGHSEFERVGANARMMLGAEQRAIAVAIGDAVAAWVVVEVDAAEEQAIAADLATAERDLQAAEADLQAAVDADGDLQAVLRLRDRVRVELPSTVAYHRLRLQYLRFGAATASAERAEALTDAQRAAVDAAREHLEAARAAVPEAEKGVREASARADVAYRTRDRLRAAADTARTEYVQQQQAEEAARQQRRRSIEVLAS